jgi:multidrug resistance efflux pump
MRDDEKLALDTQRVGVHLMSLQAEVEAKVRRVRRFREQMQQLDGGPDGRRNTDQRRRAAGALIRQVDQMLQTNLLVRELLRELREAAEAVLADLSAKSRPAAFKARRRPRVSGSTTSRSRDGSSRATSNCRLP